ncbi:MAG: hypothetical protein ACI4PC_01630 [Oscillospiraceae bacterium]
MNTRKRSKFLGLFLVLAMAVSLVTPAFAVGSANGNLTDEAGDYYYEAPTYPVSTDDNYITASAHRAASPLLGMLGVNAVSGFGMINGGAPADLAAAQQAAAVGIWGSSINENPDPWYWNYFYNFYAAENGLETVENALNNANAQASPTAADSTPVEAYGNVSVSISGRPQILIGCGSTNTNTDVNGYDSQIAIINSFPPDSPYYKEGDETYSPIQVAYTTTNIQNMIDSVYAAARAIKQVEAETGKTTRYGDVMEIAADYETYVKGTIAYVLEELNAKGMKEKTVAVLKSYDEATGMYTLADENSLAGTSTYRPYEYVMNVSKNLADETGLTVSAADLCAKADAIVCFQGTIENAGDGASQITQDSILESFGENVFDGIILATQPSTLYGMTMNSVENAMGYAYTIGYIYSDVIDIDPVEMCAYFYQHFLHVTSADGLATVIRNNFEDVILPEGSTTTLAATYSEAAIEAKLAKGISYWKSNPGKFTDAEFDRCGMRTLGIVPTLQSLTVDGEAVEGAEIYNINGSNYFKLRDIAILLNGTEAQFSVDYDEATNTMIVNTGKAYTAIGGELASGTDKSASTVKSSQALVIDGKTINMSAAMSAYNIGGNNFFKLRDLGTALGFTVDYDEATNTMVITSAAPAAEAGAGGAGGNH